MTLHHGIIHTDKGLQTLAHTWLNRKNKHANAGSFSEV